MKSLFAFVLIVFGLSGSLLAERNRIVAPIQDNHRVMLKGHIHPKALAENDQGQVDPSRSLPYCTIALKQTPAQAADLSQLLEQQQDPSSPSYHRWLSPEEYADRFGATQDDINKISSWLQDRNLSVAAVGRARNWIAFSGSAADVQSAFGTELHEFLTNGEVRYANTTEPSIPAALQPVIRSIHGLNNFRLKPAPHTRLIRPNFNSSRGAHYLAPDDLAAIYNVKPLYDSGIDGTGQKLVVVGQTQISLADIQQFRTYFNLPPNDPEVILVPNSKDPGTNSGDLGEADLDLEWAGAVARNAHLIYVYANDVMVAAQYAIDQNLAPVMTISYGDCESQYSSADATSLRDSAKQANAQGMTWFAASGDSGGADCIGGTARTTSALAVDLPASIPEVTGVGGTEFNEAGGTYWNTTADGNRASVLGYIPEVAWNDDSSGTSPSASGGGASVLFSKPSWQSGSGVPSDKAKDVPDVSLSASADHDGYITYTRGKQQIVGGTSVGSPLFAGLAALLNHYLVSNGLQANAGVGNMNPRLYALAQTTPAAFHDITTGDNIINVTCGARSRNCTAGSYGFATGPGYDLVTGLGSVDAFNLVNAWSDRSAGATLGSIQMTIAATAGSIPAGGSTLLTATVASANGRTPGGSVAFSLGGTQLGTAALAGSGGTATGTLTVSSGQLAEGNNTITALYSGDGAYSTATASVTITVASAITGPPFISGTSNGASFTQKYAPGMVLSVFGSQFASTPQSAGSVPLPKQLGGASATINGISAPLYFASPGQLNVQIPYELGASGTAVLRITNSAQQSVSSSFTLSSAAPGIFTDQTGATVPNTSASRGQFITLYVTGTGAVSPTVSTGAAPASGTAIANLPKPVQTITVQVGGVQAPIQFAGIPVGLVGVTQINYQVPTTAPLGSQAVVVTVGGIASAPATLKVTQ
jgi:uncharacterized protein (TIGR03437 family)